ncbi:Gypsy retrotransposon integrase-like protein 1 [Elysia marginata]|uniref:Gypsy retrotransposon integrase-like protein 1 n=1 Tax=Elysia marginata TaxID=1093978 RepID=A0AAV4JVG9_9GAST|nr:Gypsy retrotransposon integrase-like protein 1 [Elysia marginata]
MLVAHDSLTGAHLGIRRTKDKVLINFYWPGVDGDVTRYCRSCDVCQRTVKKGIVPRVPLEKVPLIDTLFKRMVMNIVGPITPPSEAGHRIILTLIDYATRYAEAVPLRKIDTETVAEALVDIYSRLGEPEEVLSDKKNTVHVRLYEGSLSPPWYQTEGHDSVSS